MNNILESKGKSLVYTYTYIEGFFFISSSKHVNYTKKNITRCVIMSKTRLVVLRFFDGVQCEDDVLGGDVEPDTHARTGAPAVSQDQSG